MEGYFIGAIITVINFIIFCLVWALILLFGLKVIYKIKFKDTLKNYSIFIPIILLICISIIPYIGASLLKDYFTTPDNDHCEDCHKEQYDSFYNLNGSNNPHTSNKCIDCHSEHKYIRVNFETCNSCHSLDNVSLHDVNTKTCYQCHDMEKYIHSNKSS